ncbi:hypothetical protein KQI42_15715 [Tissierella sp. MSJ-40]|uniref:Uncharacterized protein n=1 Tax=Tissierella simiarum TaxID=2841534 RepID=A0ABS6E956_9FIRM|nr:hypothetical protein [Tissierella simiarum]MBU5439462.1 hypothetical protein [Tissierella simiarum]
MKTYKIGQVIEIEGLKYMIVREGGREYSVVASLLNGENLILLEGKIHGVDYDSLAETIINLFDPYVDIYDEDFWIEIEGSLLSWLYEFRFKDNRKEG